jgi:hypothetical protein
MYLSQVIAVFTLAAAGVSASPTPGWGKGGWHPTFKPPIIVLPPTHVQQTNNCAQNFQAACCDSSNELVSFNCASLIIIIGNNDVVQNTNGCASSQTNACCNTLTVSALIVANKQALTNRGS